MNGVSHDHHHDDDRQEGEEQEEKNRRRRTEGRKEKQRQGNSRLTHRSTSLSTDEIERHFLSVVKVLTT